MYLVKIVFLFTLLGSALYGRAVAPGEVIINEVYFNLLESPEPNHFEAVELLVVKSGLDLNGLQISDRDIWNRQSEDQCTVQDLGQGFLGNLRPGTLIVLYNGIGTDDTNASDFVLRFYAQSSLFCNSAPHTNSFRIADSGDNLHLLHLGKQVDFLKYRTKTGKLTSADPGELGWDGGVKATIDVGKEDENVGFRFLGDKPELNDYPAAWRPYTEPYLETNNLGEPNGGKNSDWIEKLRKLKL